MTSPMDLSLGLRFAGRLADLAPADEVWLLDRSTSTDENVRTRTAEIVARVRRDGDRALLELARELDGASITALEVPRERLTRALDSLDPEVRRAMERAAENIARVHRAFLPQASETSPEPGIVIGRRPDPLGRVGVYAPGGRATYPSSVLMGAVPARVAGVGEIILCSPPGPDGLPSAALLAAARLAEVDRVFAIGGAGAIAALAYGTESVPRVDRIVGPGNAYVAEAKLQVAGAVAIDSPAGPSEILVIGGASSDPALVARELLAQAEHDPRACAVAVMLGAARADAVVAELQRQVMEEPRRAIIEEALANHGAVLWTESLDDAVAFGNRYAPEHLLLDVDERESEHALPRLRNAGTIFVGASSSNAFGDYMTGGNHVLPTGGLARSYSGLSVLDFIRWTTYQRVDPAAAARLAADVGRFAEAEALPGHARAARAWLDPSRSSSAPAMAGGGSSPAMRLARPEIAVLPLYAPGVGEAPCAIDVSDNTNLWGLPPAAERILRDTPRDAVTRYPSLYSGPLKERLRQYVGIADAEVVTGCGSDDVLDAVMRAFGAPGDSIAFSSPTFSMIPTFARINGLRAIAVPLRDESGAYDIDPVRLAGTGAKLVYVCAPNNPTGTSISRAAFEELLDRAEGIVILDEAYAEFADVSHVDLVARSPRLLVTRTLSKAFGLAGLRVGYAAANGELARIVERARGPYKVNALGERAALAALEEGADGLGWMRAHAQLAIENRERVSGALRRLGLEPLPSAANFVFVPTIEAPEIARRLRARGILVRAHSGLPVHLTKLREAGGHALRIGIGPWSVMEQVLGALEETLA